MSIKNDTAYPVMPEQPVHHVRLVEDKRKNGLGVAALVVGIVAAVFSIIPLIGMIAFFLGPVAIILSIIALCLRNRKKGMAVTGLILGVVSLIVAGMMTAGISAAAKSVDETINAEHTVEYVVTTSGPAHISYWTPGGTSTEDITTEWKKSITSKEFNVTSISVTGSYSDASGAVTCEILVDGKSAGQNTGNGSGAHASCSGNTWQK
jgi:ABC-type transport system involved in multi-copper enzyme maturation permease subunit